MSVVERTQCTHTLLHDMHVWSLAYAAKGKQLLSTSMNRNLRLWDAETGEQLRDLSGHTADVTCVAVHPTQPRFVTGSGDHSLIVWNAENQSPVHTLNDHTDGIRSIAFEPTEGRTFVSASWDGTLRVYDSNTYRCLAVLADHEDAVFCVAFHPRFAFFLFFSQPTLGVGFSARQISPFFSIYQSWLSALILSLSLCPLICFPHPSLSFFFRILL